MICVSKNLCIFVFYIYPGNDGKHCRQIVNGTNTHRPFFADYYIRVVSG